jgi:hypothetical protein
MSGFSRSKRGSGCEAKRTVMDRCNLYINGQAQPVHSERVSSARGAEARLLRKQEAGRSVRSLLLGSWLSLGAFKARGCAGHTRTHGTIP